MSETILYLSKEQINWDVINIRYKHGEESLELWNSIEAHGQLEPGAGWWDEAGKFRILFGHRRAFVLAAHGMLFMARLVPQEDEINVIEKQIIENEQRLELTPGELENAITQLLDYYSDDLVKLSERIGKSREWILSKKKNREIRDSLIDSLTDGSPGINITNVHIEKMSGRHLDAINKSNLTPKEKLEVLSKANTLPGGVSPKSIQNEVQKKELEHDIQREIKLKISLLKNDRENLRTQITLLHQKLQNIEEQIVVFEHQIVEK